MVAHQDAREKIIAGYQLLQGADISISSFEHIRTLLQGINPQLDQRLTDCSRALAKVQQVKSGDLITLSAEGLPENTQENKRRKKALLLFISAYKKLKTEVRRLDSELSQSGGLATWGRIIGLAKGPLGITTILALIIVGIILVGRNNSTPLPPMLRIITYQDKQIPLDQLHVGSGPECDGPHYHANAGSVTTLDGTSIPDPGPCGYGKVQDLRVTEVPVSP